MAPGYSRTPLGRGRLGSEGAEDAAKAVARRLELSAMETGCKNDDLVSVVNTGGGHWAELRVEKPTSQIIIYDPLQTGRLALAHALAVGREVPTPRRLPSPVRGRWAEAIR